MNPAWLLLAAFIAIVLLGGCGIVTADLDAAAARLSMAQSLGLLAPTDPALACVTYLKAEMDGLEKVRNAADARGLISAGVPLYVIRQRADAGAMEQQCGAVMMKLMRNGAQRAPGL